MSWSNTKYLLDVQNKATLAGVVVCNSDHTTYPTAPDPIVGEDDAWPMSNLITRDRNAPCLIGPGQPATLEIVIKLVASASVKTIGLLGAEWWTGSTGPTEYKVYYSTSSSYPSSWTNFLAADAAITWDGSRNSVTVLPTSAVGSVRFVKFSFLDADASTGFSIGKFLVAATPSDLGGLYAPGATYAPLFARSRVTTVDGRPSVTEYGPKRQLVTLPFRNTSHTTRTALVALGDELYPFLLLLGMDGTWQECLPAEEGASSEHVWGVVESSANTTDVWTVSLTVETLY